MSLFFFFYPGNVEHSVEDEKTSKGTHPVLDLDSRALLNLQGSGPP